jgi:putative oxidoreductase
MKAKFFSTPDHPVTVDSALLLIRLVIGYAFIMHGWGKIQHPFNWMGDESAMPGIFQALAALSEFGGGMALMAGIVTRLAAFGITCTMVVAVYFHMVVMGDPFVSNTGGGSYEHALSYLVVALLILASGPGRFSLDRLIFGRD